MRWVLSGIKEWEKWLVKVMEEEGQFEWRKDGKAEVQFLPRVPSVACVASGDNSSRCMTQVRFHGGARRSGVRK